MNDGYTGGRGATTTERVSITYLPFFLWFCLWLSLGCNPTQEPKKRERRDVVPVVVAPIARGQMSAFQEFSGSLEASASFVVSSKISGRVLFVSVDIGDTVTPGAEVARIDDDEYKQTKEQARAALLVEEASLLEAQSVLEIAKRSIERTRTLHQKGVASDAELDAAESDLLAKKARVAVLEAQVIRAKSTLKQSKIQLNYAKVEASWPGSTSERVVAERFVDEGETVKVDDPLLRIVDLTPITAVFYVPEREYGNLQTGQKVSLETDAYPGETFDGTIARIAPMFQDSSRQARVEVTVPNEDTRLKPGMYVRTHVNVTTVNDAVIVPADAVVIRADAQGVFVVPNGQDVARWRPVRLGIRHGESVEVMGSNLTGRVVVLGQQLIDDGSRVAVSGSGSNSLHKER